MHSAAFLGYSHERSPHTINSGSETGLTHQSAHTSVASAVSSCVAGHSKCVIHSILHILPLGHSSILHPGVHDTRETHRREISVHSPVFHSSCAHPLPLHLCIVTIVVVCIVVVVHCRSHDRWIIPRCTNSLSSLITTLHRYHSCHYYDVVVCVVVHYSSHDRWIVPRCTNSLTPPCRHQ